MNIHDKTGRQIEIGDVLKVFHFVDYRNKRRYMYKQVTGTKTLGSGTEYLVLSHLNMSDEYYLEACDGQTLRAYEIVQSADAAFEDRPRRAPAPIPHDRPDTSVVKDSLTTADTTQEKT